MNSKNSYACSGALAAPLMTAILLCLFSGIAMASDIEGFTEPYRTVNVAAADAGIVQEILVRVGDHVNEGDLLAKLDSDLHSIMVDMAKDKKNAEGRLKSAIAKVELKQSRYRKLVEIQESGFGRNEEVERAKKEWDVAEADLQAEQEDLLQRRWEYSKLQEQLKRRAVHAPVSGYVSATLKDPGEFVAPTEPNVITIVQLNPLLAKFSLKRADAAQLELGDEFKVTTASGFKAVGVVDSISPILDAQSGTQKIKLRIPNDKGRIISGERCRIELPTTFSRKPGSEMVFGRRSKQN